MHGLQGNHGPCNVGQQDNGEIRGIERKRERKRESSRTFYNGSSHSGSEYLRVYVTCMLVTRSPAESVLN